jgi:hypothetical protein
MSYDLDFWRYKSGVALDHQSVYEQLSQGQRVEGLDDLPIETMIRRVNEMFADWEKLDEATFEGGERGSFQLFTTAQFFRVDTYGMDGDDLNKLIEIGNEFGCPLYDPQVGQRYDC